MHKSAMFATFTHAHLLFVFEVYLIFFPPHDALVCMFDIISVLFLNNNTSGSLFSRSVCHGTECDSNILLQR